MEYVEDCPLHYGKVCSKNCKSWSCYGAYHCSLLENISYLSYIKKVHDNLDRIADALEKLALQTVADKQPDSKE